MPEVANRVQIGELERVHNGQLLAEHSIADLYRSPCGEVVRVRACDVLVAQEMSVRVHVDRIDGHFIQAVEKLLLVHGTTAEHLAELPAAHEMKGRL